jgi:hypothetical protein
MIRHYCCTTNLNSFGVRLARRILGVIFRRH